MPNITDDTLHQFDALNHWLSDVYGEEKGFSTLVLEADFSEAEIELIKREHLSEFLQAVIDLLASYNDFSNNARYNVMLEHYGLIDGKPLDFYVIGHRYGVAGERIRQLVNRRLDLYRDSKRQAAFRHDLTAIVRRLLDNESRSQQ
jgi:DNA-directed RNA polymerase sigma subunit (sigma70/sigma32)